MSQGWAGEMSQCDSEEWDSAKAELVAARNLRDSTGTGVAGHWKSNVRQKQIRDGRLLIRV